MVLTSCALVVMRKYGHGCDSHSWPIEKSEPIIVRWEFMWELIFVKHVASAHLYVSVTAEIKRQNLASCFVPRGCIVKTLLRWN